MVDYANVSDALADKELSDMRLDSAADPSNEIAVTREIIRAVCDAYDAGADVKEIKKTLKFSGKANKGSKHSDKLSLSFKQIREILEHRESVIAARLAGE